VLGSERLTGAMLDRLTHRVHILEANARAIGYGTPNDASNASKSTAGGAS